jgi:acetoin utilization deacetylase AcuC-like enzyme
MTPEFRRLPWVWAPEYEMEIGPHVFPTVKYRLVRDLLVEEGTLREADFLVPAAAPHEDLRLVHTPGYLRRALGTGLTTAEERLLELPFSEALRDAFILSCGGSTLAARAAMETGVAVHLGGGFHHAFADHGEGFCLLNDVAVAVESARAEGGLDRAAVVDLDVHHGNGTARIFRDEPRVFTFSMHQERNYPFAKPPGDLDLGLDDGLGDEGYLALLRKHLPPILDGHAPQLVMYLAGADPYRQDQLGGLRLSMEGLRERDRIVLGGCRRRGIPVVVTLAGGYAARLEDTVEIHANTVREAARVARQSGRAEGDSTSGR